MLSVFEFSLREEEPLVLPFLSNLVQVAFLCQTLICLQVAYTEVQQSTRKYRHVFSSRQKRSRAKLFVLLNVNFTVCLEWADGHEGGSFALFRSQNLRCLPTIQSSV